MTVWTWSFCNALVADEHELADVVKEVSYVVRGTRGEGLAANYYEIGGRTALDIADTNNFIPFAYLTVENLTNMVCSMVNSEALKRQIEAWFDAEAKVKPLPFE